MITYIVCQGLIDEQLLKTVLSKKIPSGIETKIVSGGGLSSIKSLARSLVARRQSPVVIVVDADSVAPEFIQERRQEIVDIVKIVAGNVPFQVCLAVPEIETIFFQDISLLSRLLGYTPSQNALDLAVTQPKQVLKQLLTQSNKIHNLSGMINQLDNEDTAILYKVPIMLEVIHFLESVVDIPQAV